MSEFIFSEKAWGDYLFFQQNDKQLLKKINELLKDISRNGTRKGIGQVEQLKYKDKEIWSRRINSEHRLVYSEENGAVKIWSLKGHYTK